MGWALRTGSGIASMRIISFAWTLALQSLVGLFLLWAAFMVLAGLALATFAMVMMLLTAFGVAT